MDLKRACYIKFTSVFQIWIFFFRRRLIGLCFSKADITRTDILSKKRKISVWRKREELDDYSAWYSKDRGLEGFKRDGHLFYTPWKGPKNIFVVVQLLNRIWLFETPQTVAHQAPLSFSTSQFAQIMSTESVMLSNYLMFRGPLILLSSIFPRIKIFSSQSALHIRWPRDWSFSISPLQWMFRIDSL